MSCVGSIKSSLRECYSVLSKSDPQFWWILVSPSMKWRSWAGRANSTVSSSTACWPELCLMISWPTYMTNQTERRALGAGPYRLDGLCDPSSSFPREHLPCLTMESSPWFSMMVNWPTHLSWAPFPWENLWPDICFDGRSSDPYHLGFPSIENVEPVQLPRILFKALTGKSSQPSRSKNWVSCQLNQTVNGHVKIAYLHSQPNWCT